ncbi:MAG TPA: hypothetical protein VFL62_22860 [Bradyrhizobium sp.]|uniref:hypothetical protein n=1 Tax=Bradyrhizobium sp. TaxID=376 RepID=UPI002D7FFD88|nr:hypothetical protein [Bradyrhizobium sp.]HET7889079.1 hypothetical protein [Bradyrhizobium sp.]
MSLSDKPERKFSLFEVAGYAVLIAIAAGFLALHIVAGNIDLPGSRSVPAEAARLSGD